MKTRNTVIPTGDIMSKPYVNKPYQFKSAKRFDNRAGIQFRWPGQFIEKIVNKHNLSIADFTRLCKIAGDEYEDESGKGISPSSASIYKYINGYKYKKKRVFPSVQAATDFIIKYNANCSLNGIGGQAAIVGNYDDSSVRVKVEILEHRCCCPKMDNLVAIADAIDALEGTDNAFVLMTGRMDKIAMAIRPHRKRKVA